MELECSVPLTVGVSSALTPSTPPRPEGATNQRMAHSTGLMPAKCHRHFLEDVSKGYSVETPFLRPGGLDQVGLKIWEGKVS